MSMDEKLKEALARAAAQEQSAAKEKRVQSLATEAWYSGLAAERVAAVDSNWRSTLAWIAEGKASRDAALDAFLSVYGTPEQATITLETRSRKLMFVPVEVARALRSPPLHPPLLEAYRVWARGAADPEAAARLAAVGARLARLAPKVDETEFKAAEARQLADDAETTLGAARMANAAKLAAFYEETHWVSRKFSPEGRAQYAALRQEIEDAEKALALTLASASSAAALAEGEVLFAQDELRAAVTEHERLVVRIARAEQGLLAPLGFEPTGRSPLSMVAVPEGRFWMGSADMGGVRREEVPLRRVERSMPFEIGVYPVTQALYLAVMGDNPSRFPNPISPANRVRWYDACRFCNALSDRLGRTRAYHIDEQSLKVSWRKRADGFRLPTEAEWECAARAGESHEYAGGDQLDKVGWYAENGNNAPRPVGGRRPNKLGLCDMSGNVWEWCYDGYADDQYRTSPAVDPLGPETAPTRVMRGGSTTDAAERCRVAARADAPPEGQDVFLGFRIACGPAAPPDLVP